MSPLSHAEIRQLLEQAADGLLKLSDQRKLEKHLASCAECRAFANELSALEGALRGTLLAHWPETGMPGPAKQDLIKHLQKQAAPGAAAAATGGTSWLLWLVVALLVAAGFFWLLWPQGGQSLPAGEPTATSSASPTAIVSATATLSGAVVATETPGQLVLIAIPNRTANCREGNGSAFEIADTLMEDHEYLPTGRGRDELWVRFNGPAFGQPCWVLAENLDFFLNDDLIQLEGVPESVLPYLDYPPTPTPSSTPTFTPEPQDPFVPQCNDGLDNDGDKRTDLADTSCRDANDNDESN